MSSYSVTRSGFLRQVNVLRSLYGQTDYIGKRGTVLFNAVTSGCLSTLNINDLIRRNYVQSLNICNIIIQSHMDILLQTQNSNV